MAVPCSRNFFGAIRQKTSAKKIITVIMLAVDGKNKANVAQRYRPHRVSLKRSPQTPLFRDRERLQPAAPACTSP
jgi:hypothetical protein